MPGTSSQSQLSAPSNDYGILAKYYDSAYAVKPDLVDLPFYLELAEQSGGPVLEIACGTGRVLLPIARKGIHIEGVDNSQPMLKVLKGHLAKEPAEVQRLVSLHEGDMRNFRLGLEFPLIIIPFRPMQHMSTVEDQLSALQTAAAHLSPGGTLAFDVFFPKFAMIDSGTGEELQELEWPSPADPSTIVRRYFKKEWVDKVNQVFHFIFIFRTFRDGNLVREESERFSLSYYTYPHLKALFLLAALKPVAEYGSFDKGPIDNDAQQMIFLLKKG